MQTLLPIVIGVTGHRDLREEDTAELGDAVRQILAEIASNLPNSPLVVLSALAEGSDRLVAREALRLGHSVIVPIPMPEAIYQEEFESEASRREFEELREQASRSFELPLLNGVDPDARVLDRDTRRTQYQQLGVFLVRHAQILIALWDGKMSDDPGGTSHVVDINLRCGPGRGHGFGGLETVSPDDLDPWDRGPLYHIVTPRASDPVPVGKPFAIHKLFPDSLDGASNPSERHQAILARIDLLNDQIRRGGASLGAEAQISADGLIPESVQSEIGGKQSELLRRFGVADALAERMQRHYRRSLISLLGLVLLALGSFEVYDNLLPEETRADLWSLLVLAAYPAALSIAYIGYGYVKRKEYQDRHLDYRALAEGLRVQLFWRIVALDEEVSDHYLRKQSGELRWIHEAIRVANIPDGEPPAEDAAVLADHGQRVLRYWLEAQHAYYAGAAVRDARSLRVGSHFATTFYVGSLVSTLLVLMLDGFVRFGLESDFLLGMRPYLFMGIALMLGLSVLVRAYSEKMGLSEQTLQYQRMRDLFGRAERALHVGLAQRDVVAVRSVLLELGEEALQENADWVLFRRSRGIEIH